MSRSVVLEVQGVAAGYGRTEVLRGVDLRVLEGEVACLVGPSGCGKSTLLRCIAGFEPVTAGAISLKERRVAAPGAHVPPDKRRVGVVFQDYALFPHLDVEANVGFGLAALKRTARAAKVKELLATVDLAGAAARYPHELSGGQQQRVALARALATEPDLLLLDEPFSNLDPELSKRLLQELRRLLRSLGLTVVMVTHDHDEAFDVADVMGVMVQGRILQWGEPLALYRRPAAREVAEALGDCAFLPVEHGACELGPVPGASARGQLMLRPTDVALADGAAANAEVLGVSFRGTHFLYRLRLASGTTLRCFAPATERPPAAGSRVGVKVVAREPVMFGPSS